MMKKALSLTLAAILASSALASCASAPTESASTASAYADASWLKSRLGEMPDNVTVGTADSPGIDMTDFEDDGYLIRTMDDETVVCGKTSDGLDRAVRKYATCVKYGRAIEDVTYHEGARIERLTIAGRDIADFTVVYTHTVEPLYPYLGFTPGNGEYAAKDFVRLIEEATGITLPTFELSSGEEVPSPAVYFEADDSPAEENPFGMTGYAYEVKDGELYFDGSGLSGGTVNGVWYFLEHECGWSNLTFGDAILAEADAIDIPEGLSHSGTTAFETYYPSGINFDYYHIGHTTHRGTYTVAEHGIEHNNFIDGIDLATEQPCYTDQEILENCIENVLLYLEANPGAYYVDIAQPDNNNWCQCKSCRAVFKEEGGQAGVVTRFSNALSEAVDAEHLGLKYLMFAYAQTKQPPKVTRPNDLISVTFCFDGSCYNHAVNSGLCTEQTSRTKKYWTGITNADFAEWIEGWCAICGDMYVWYYTMDGGCSQYNTLTVLYEDMTYFRSIGVKNVLIENDYHGQGLGRLCSDMIGALQYEPDMTYDEYLAVLERKVCEYYGGEDYEDFETVAEILHESMMRNGCETCWYDENINPSDAMEYVGKKLDIAVAALDEMIADAPSYEAELNCKRLSLMVIYEGIYGRYVYGDHGDLDYLEQLYGVFADRAVECGFDLTHFEVGICFEREFSDTLAGEIEYWKTR